MRITAPACQEAQPTNDAHSTPAEDDIQTEAVVRSIERVAMLQRPLLSLGALGEQHQVLGLAACQVLVRTLLADDCTIGHLSLNGMGITEAVAAELTPGLLGCTRAQQVDSAAV